MDKISKLVLPVVILIASFIVGMFFYASQVNKQKSIEKQQEIKMAQDQKEYVAKRRNECYSIYERERKQFNNVENFGYVEICSGPLSPCQNDSCEIIYKDSKSGEYFRKYY